MEAEEKEPQKTSENSSAFSMSVLIMDQLGAIRLPMVPFEFNLELINL